ncbi:AMP-binding protein [Sphingomicrobium clamense]|uniref:AMP-binding protein n=1 Tax=Sphingomicrobium clamense TaxID=2851013 RepID=A0ABS6V6Y8_9SPHN|nr:AMP-binding protein [Sphingomicrobium sp. B8]MBW0144952.1 AMP-binding protein [Sphingomicrobium sp. B8]
MIKPIDHLPQQGAPQAIAIVVGEERLDYAGLEERVGRVAAKLRALGVEPGDRVASWDKKTMLAAILPMAVARAGAIHVPINPLLKAAQATHILEDSGAKLLIANKARFESVEWEGVASEDWEDGEDALEPSAANPDTPVALMYTSGSTGRPKGVMLSHANLWLGADSVATFLGLEAHTKSLCVLPLSFDYGQNNLLATLYAGGTAVLFDYLLPRDVARAIQRYEITYLGGVPPLWHQLARLDWSSGAGTSLETLANSGGHVPEPLYRTLRETFPQAKLHLMYGLTEAFRAASLDPLLADTHPDSVGTAIPHAELMIVREDGSLCDADEEGELVQAGPLVAQGYWNQPEKTAARFRPAPEASEMGGTAVWSGDRMVRGKDGLLRFRSRADAMIKVSGNRLSPTEVEEIALESGLASEAVAIGKPDEELGQHIVLHVVAATQEDDDTMRKYFREQAPSYMMPHMIVWHAQMPTGPNGKVDRVRLEKMG